MRPVHRPQEESFRVALNRLRRCPAAVTEEFWPPRRKKKLHRRTLPRNQKTWEGIGEDAYETDSLSRARTPSIRAGTCNSYNLF